MKAEQKTALKAALKAEGNRQKKRKLVEPRVLSALRARWTTLFGDDSVPSELNDPVKR